MTETNSSIESVSLLLGASQVPVWFGLAVEELRTKTDIRVDDVTIAMPSAQNDNGPKQRLQDFVVRIQNQVILSDLDAEIDVRLLPAVSTELVHRCSAERTGEVRVTLPAEEVSRIADTVDIVIHHGVGILKGDILRTPRWGVLGYHHGDIREYRGPGYGFWEYMNDEKKSGVTLQVLDDRLDSGEVVDIVPVDISDAHTLAEVRTRLNAASVPLLASGIKKLNIPDFSPIKLSDSELGKMYYYSDATMAVKLRYLLKECRSRFG